MALSDVVGRLLAGFVIAAAFSGLVPGECFPALVGVVERGGGETASWLRVVRRSTAAGSSSLGCVALPLRLTTSGKGTRQPLRCEWLQPLTATRRGRLQLK